MNSIRITCNRYDAQLSVIAMELLENTKSLLATIYEGDYRLFDNNHLNKYGD
jgi:hypothetical protein